MYGHVPEAFAGVSLRDGSTWHRTTLREWLEMRSHLIEKQRMQGDPWDWAKKKNGAVMDVSRRLAAEMGIHTSAPHPPKGGDVGARQAELMDELFHKRYPEYDPLTEWETEFLRVTQWLDDVRVAYESAPRETPIATLTAWLLAVEDEAGLAEQRERQRARNRDAVAVRSSRRLKSNRNPFYPRPLELVQIARAAEILVWRIKWNLTGFFTLGGPVTGTEAMAEFRVRIFLETTPWSNDLIQFLNTLRKLGYVPCRDEQECLEWHGWKRLPDEHSWTTSRALLAFMFNASPATIRKDLSDSRLDKLYGECAVPKKLRVFNRKNGPAKVAKILRAGWVSRIQNGAPSPYDVGTTYFR